MRETHRVFVHASISIETRGSRVEVSVRAIHGLRVRVGTSMFRATSPIGFEGLSTLSHDSLIDNVPRRVVKLNNIVFVFVTLSSAHSRHHPWLEYSTLRVQFS